jgi:hypothetical protein
VPPGHARQGGERGQRAGQQRGQQQQPAADAELERGGAERAADRAAQLGVGAGLEREQGAGEQGGRDEEHVHGEVP